MTRKPAKKQKAGKTDDDFARVVEAFAGDRRVSYRTGQGFGYDALKINGKIFAMISSQGKFVVKLPKTRVDELATSGRGERFSTGHGRVMKEWIAIEDREVSWIELAREAYMFVGQGKL